MVEPSSAAFGSIFTLLGSVVKRFTYTQKDFPPCNAKIVRGGRALPFSRQVVVHTTLEGKVTVKSIP